MAILEVGLNMKLRMLIVMYAFPFLITNAQATDDKLKYTAVSRCFFVYAPILEVAKWSRNSNLESYAMQRMLYMKGFLESRSDDPQFKYIFESNLSKNKSVGVLLEESLKRASTNGDKNLFNRELRKGEYCDNELGIKTK